MGVIEARVDVIKCTFVLVPGKGGRDKCIVEIPLSDQVILKGCIVPDTKANGGCERIFLIDVIVPSEIVISEQAPVTCVSPLDVQSLVYRTIIPKRPCKLLVFKTASCIVKGPAKSTKRESHLTGSQISIQAEVRSAQSDTRINIQCEAVQRILFGYYVNDPGGSFSVVLRGWGGDHFNGLDLISGYLFQSVRYAACNDRRRFVIDKHHDVLVASQ